MEKHYQPDAYGGFDEIYLQSQDKIAEVSCWALVHEGHLVIPYAMSDYATTFATIEVKELLSAMTRSTDDI